MATVKLVFSQAPVATPGTVRLVFGDDGGTPAIPDATLHGSGRITGLRLHITAGVATPLVGTGRITGLRLHLATHYDTNVSRPTVGQAAGRWQDAEPLQHAAYARWQQSARLPTGTCSRWQDAAPMAASLQTRWQDTQQRQRAVHGAFEQARRLPAAPLRASYQEAQRLRTSASDHMQQAQRLPADPLRVRYQETYRDRQLRAVACFEQAAHLARPIASAMGIALRLPAAIGGRYQQAWPPRPGQWQRPAPPLPEPCYLPTLPAHLVFDTPWTGDGRLVFVCERRAPPDPQPGETIVVPIKEAYLTINSAVLVRLDNGHVIPTTAMSMSLDVDSWTWGFSASVPGSALSDVHPNSNGDPVVVQATINGTAFRFILERVSRDRTFNTSQLRVSGRGVGAELDAPYAVQMAFGNTQARTTRQLLDDILTHNGVSIGWDVGLWQPTDWLVPAGVFSHSGTYASALNAVVGAAGAYLQPHNTARTLDVRLRYPTPSWQWASVTPQFELPAAVTTQEGFEWVDKPAYNRVFVTGQEHGVNGQYTRAGTAGDLVAPEVVDPLITHADAARQRGRAVLSDTGRIATVTLRLPVLAETGIIKPGSFVRYTEGGNTHMGLTRGVSVAVGMPATYQTLTLETHVEPF